MLWLVTLMVGDLDLGDRDLRLLALLWSWPVIEGTGCCETHRLLDEAAVETNPTI